MELSQKYFGIGQKIINTMTINGMDKLINDAAFVFVGLSGGADSTLLLMFLNDYLLEIGLKHKLKAIHVNHCIRGDDADSDEKFCLDLCKKIDIELISKHIDVPTSAKENGEGIEEAARRERYSFFDEVISGFDNKSKSLVALAHNSSDNLETIILNILRGSGALGLSGIPAVRDGKYIRPFINISSEEIRNYCKDNNIDYCIDKTNFDTNYRRNYLRNEIVPKLRELVPNPEVSALRMSSLIKEDNDYLTLESLKISENLENSIPIALFDTLHTAILTRVIRQVYDKVVMSDTSLEIVHVNSIINLVKTRKNGSKIVLPDNISAIIVNDDLVFEYLDEVSDSFEEKLLMGNNKFDGKKLTIVLSFTKLQENIYKNFIYKVFDFDKINGELFVRSRRHGDTCKFGGITRKVKKLLSDKKIPLKDRHLVPIICDNDGIVWIPGFDQRDTTKISEGSKKLYIYVKSDYYGG